MNCVLFMYRDAKKRCILERKNVRLFTIFPAVRKQKHFDLSCLRIAAVNYSLGARNEKKMGSVEKGKIYSVEITILM